MWGDSPQLSKSRRPSRENNQPPTGQQLPDSTGRDGSASGRGGPSRLERFREIIIWPESVIAGAAVWLVGLILHYILIWWFEVGEDRLDLAIVVYYESVGGVVFEDAYEAEILNLLTTGQYQFELDHNAFGGVPVVHMLVPALLLVIGGHILAGRHIKAGETKRPLEGIIAGASLAIWFTLALVLAVAIGDTDELEINMGEVLLMTLLYSGVFAIIGATIRSGVELRSGGEIIGGVGAFFVALLAWYVIEDPFEDEFAGVESFSDLEGTLQHVEFFLWFVSKHGLEVDTIMPEWYVILVPLLFGAGLAYIYERRDPLVGLGEGAKLGAGYVIPVFVVMVIYAVATAREFERDFDDWPELAVQSMNFIIAAVPRSILLAGIVYPVVFAALGGAIGAFVYRAQTEQTADRSRQQPRQQQYQQEPTGQQPPPQQSSNQQPPAGQSEQEPTDQPTDDPTGQGTTNASTTQAAGGAAGARSDDEQEDDAGDLLDDQLDDATTNLDTARQAREAGEYYRALMLCGQAIESVEQARETARSDAPDRVTEVESCLDDATQLREAIVAERDVREYATTGLDSIADRLDELSEALDERDPVETRQHLDEISASLADASKPIDEHGFDDLGERIEELGQQYRALRRRAQAAQTRQEVREEVSDRLDTADQHLDAVASVLDDGRPREALDLLDDLPATLDEAREPIDEHDLADLGERLDALEARHERLHETALGRDARTQVPTVIPGVRRLSLSYDDIQKGNLLGRGGNADVYYATVRTDDGEADLAVKEPRVGGTLHTETVERMMAEAETWQQLDDHHHIVSVVDYGGQPLPWIAMEYMDGGHLGERTEEMELRQKLWTSLAVTEAVDHAHRHAVVHRDLKPENILFREVDDGWDVPKVADWGLSKHLLEHSKSREGLTVEYAAPEQFDSDAGTDRRTDIYQLGAVFYELFTRRPPFEGEMFEVMKQIESEKPTLPSALADVPAELDDILLQAMAKEPEERYKRVVYLRDDLQAMSDQH